MAKIFDRDARSAIRMALARDSYEHDTFRLVEPNLGEARWLATTQSGLFAVSDHGAHILAYGWFFGLCRRGSRIFLFENCARRDRHRPLGRLVALDLVDGTLNNPTVLAKGLDANCHQIAFVEDLLCVVDTANQCVLRFTDQGLPVDVKRPFPQARPNDEAGNYMHINAIAAMPDGIAIMAHNSKRVPPQSSEIIHLDHHWNETERTALIGTGNHDIVRDSDGSLWHCASVTGEIACSDGRRVQVTADRMTRGLLFDDDRILVGTSVFGERSFRDNLPGSVIVLDRSFTQVAEIPVDGPPASIIAL